MAPAGEKLDPREWTSIRPALEPWLLEAIAAHGYTRCTPVQASTVCPEFIASELFN